MFPTELLRNVTFANSSRPFYQKGRLTFAVFPLK